MGADKLSAPLGGVPVLQLSAAAFLDTPGCARLVVVCQPPRIEEFRALLGPLASRALFAPAGELRQDSTASGLSLLLSLPSSDPGRLVAIHDAARPLVTPALIASVVAEAARHGAAACAVPVADTLMKAGPDAIAIEPVPRDGLWAMQTPQVFRLAQIAAALGAARAAGRVVTDEVSAMLAAGHPVRLVTHSGWNPKITYPPDLTLAEALLAARRPPPAPSPAGGSLTP